MLQDEISQRKNYEYVGKAVRILIDSEEIRDNCRVLTGKTDTAKPVHVKSESAKVGSFLNVKITKSSVSHLFGEEIK